MDQNDFRDAVVLAIIPVMLNRALTLCDPNSIPDESIISRAFLFANKAATQRTREPNHET